ncbi:MAG: efflux RND transporter permease subunit [Candidatus Natronoplasma sp.]
MDVKSWFQKKIFDSFPLLVSGSPSKIIAVIIVLTLILGYFASFAEMDTDEETFEPDTQTADRMDEIEEEFGTAGDYSQVVFIGDIGDTLTQEVLLDMLHTKEAILEHEEINQTLMKDGGVPDGVMTLADIVIQANRTQQLSRSLENIYDDLEELHVSMKNQTEMYERLNISLQNNHILAESSDQDIREESKEIFKSMSYIISNPDSWEILQEYMDMLERILDPDSTEGTAGVNENTSEDDEEIPEEGQYFIEMFEASARILYENDPTPEERRAVGRMLTYFLEISEHIAHVKPDFGFVEDIPSVEPTLDEKKEQVENMTDRDIKRSLKEVHEYEPELLRDSIDRSVDILGEAEKEDEGSYDHLEDTNETLENLEEIYEEESWEKEMEPYVENYSSTLDGYFDLLDGTLDVITGMSVTMRSAEFLPDLIHEMARTTVSISSEEFDGEDLVVRRIRARSGMALVLMNDSIDSDTRREAQEELIELTEEIPENSHTKVYASQVMLEEINDSAMRSMSRLLPLAFVFVVFVLILVYKSVTETLLSLISLTIAIIWTFGAGVLLGYKFNPLIVAVPILLTGLIIDYGIHMVMRYREEKAKSKSPSASTKIAIITVGGALLLTTVTTAIGFLSNVFSDLLVIRQFGILAAIGICSSLILMVGFLPAILQIVEEKGLDEKNKKTEKKLDSTDKNDSNKYTKKFLSISSIIANKKPWAIIVATLLITMVAGYGAANVDTTFNIEDFLPEGEPQSENIDYINADYNISTSTVYIIVEGDVAERDFLYAVDHVEFNSRDNRYIMDEEGVNSPLSVLQEYGTATVGQDHYNETIVDAFRESDTEGNEIPDKDIEELYDLLYEAPESRDSMRRVLSRDEDGDYEAALLTFTENEELINRDLDNAVRMKEQLEEDSEPLRFAGYTTKVTSSSIVNQETTEKLTNTQILSLTLTIIIVATILTLIFYSSKKTKILGLITTFPVSLVTIWIIGMMYALDVPLNVLTVTITALTVGMGVDFSIHVAHRFLEELEEGKELFEASQETVLNTGSALFGSAATTVGAFGILSTSNIVPLSQFGYITAMAISYSFIVAVFLLPSTLAVWVKFTDIQERLIDEKASKKKKEELPVLKKKGESLQK